MLIGLNTPSNGMAPFGCIGYSPEYCEVLKQPELNGQVHTMALVLLFGVMLPGAVLA